MSFETGAPPPPEPLPPPARVAADRDQAAAARPARSFDATTAILPGPPPGTSTYRLRAAETTSTDGPPTG